MKPLYVLIGSALPLDELGGKGFHLSRMTNLGLPVPPGVIIPTSVCREWMESPEAIEKALDETVPEILEWFKGAPVSVRSGAKFSMPGMMDTILNLGVSKEFFPTEEAYLESLRRFYVMYGNVVFGVEREKLERTALVKLIAEYGTDPRLHLFNSIRAVFKSWENERAKVYRDLHGIPHDLGTGVIVQRMVFGNYNEHSATGVLFTRDPASGSNEFVGEFLVNAQGEDIVAGIRTPEPISNFAAWNTSIASELFEIASDLETKSKDVQDIEFTVENGKLWILQTRNAKRTPRAAVKVVNDLIHEGVIGYEEGLSRLTLKTVLAASTTEIDSSFEVAEVATGIGASAGVASGIAVFSKEEALKCSKPCILVTEETNPDDLPGIAKAAGILTATGGSTSHAAVVARGLNKVAVVGCSALKRSLKGWALDGISLEGKLVTLDGVTGRIWVGVEVPILSGENTEVAKLKGLVRSNNRKIWKLAESSDDILPVGTIYRAELGGLAELAKVVRTMKKGVIDLRGPESMVLPEFEETLLGVFGDKGYLPTAIDKLVSSLLRKVIKDKEIYVILPPSLEGLDKQFAEKGYLPVSVSDDLAEVVSKEGPFGLEREDLIPYYSGVSKVKKAEGSRVFPLFYTKNTEIGLAPLTDTALLQAILPG